MLRDYYNFSTSVNKARELLISVISITVLISTESLCVDLHTCCKRFGRTEELRASFVLRIVEVNANIDSCVETSESSSLKLRSIKTLVFK